MKSAISKNNIKSFHKAFADNPANKLARNAVTRSKLIDVAMNWDTFRKIDHIYSHKKLTLILHYQL